MNSNLDVDREWDFIVSEVHGEKPNGKNLLKRELLLTLRAILSKIDIKKDRKENHLLREVYLKTKEKYLNY